jgi:hypothetical protein
MKTLKYLVVAAVAVPVLAGPAAAQTARPAAPAPAASEEAAKAAPKSLAGELVAADQAARTVTVKQMVDRKAVQHTFGADEATFAALAHIKPGDHVKVTYVERGDKRIIRSIVKG